MRLPLVRTLVVASVLLAAVPSVAQDASPSIDASPSPAPSVANGVDITAALPATIGGVLPDVQIQRGHELLEDLDPADPADAELLEYYDQFTLALGASIDDVTSLAAVADHGETISLVLGTQVNGAEPDALLTTYIDSLLADMESPFQELGEIGGKTATFLVDESIDPPLGFYVYGSGPQVWLIVADDPIVEDVLAQLP